MNIFALDKDGKLIYIPGDTGTERVLPDRMTSNMDKEQLDILDKIEKLIRENEEYKQYKELYKCLRYSVSKTVDADTFEMIIDRAELLKLKGLFKEDK